MVFVQAAAIGVQAHGSGDLLFYTQPLDVTGRDRLSSAPHLSTERTKNWPRRSGKSLINRMGLWWAWMVFVLLVQVCVCVCVLSLIHI